ncbi:MAG: hypothetical protein COZ69_11140 [Deltaproteobacteria bacterium CG_4_8_14_3_um_filter_45_9]|nr:MAG: hypothetical protein COZ69_11140 [Deltaproteobacteria bacterium CG_4_8_14_3_um_filter_45_9]
MFLSWRSQAFPQKNSSSRLRFSCIYFSLSKCLEIGDVRPEIIGWAQVNYPYGASVEDAIEKLQYDLFYIQNMSFLLEIRIFLKTIQVVLFGKGSR